MRERYFRAIAFAVFATLGLMVGGFVMGYGTALLSAPSPAPVILPTLAPTPQNTPEGAPDIGSSPAGTADAGQYMDATAGQITPVPNPSPNVAPSAGGLELSLESVDVNSAQGGIEIVIHLHNRTGREANLSFWPEDDLALADDRGRRYPLRWAEYDGVVRVPAGESLRLVRAFFEGIPEDGTSYLAIKVKHPPQLPERSWQVPLTP